jgi:hypothetical protein
MISNTLCLFVYVVSTNDVCLLVSEDSQCVMFRLVLFVYVALLAGINVSAFESNLQNTHGLVVFPYS